MIPAELEVTQRAQMYAQDANPAPALAVLRTRREEILDRWLDVVARQSFHQGRREHAVADHIPALYDAVIATLEQGLRRTNGTDALDSSGVTEAAVLHAEARSREGLQPADVVIEFRLLRQEIWHALREALPDYTPLDDAVAAQLLLNDSLDAAMMVGLEHFMHSIEVLKDEFILTLTHDLRNPLTSLKGVAQLLVRHAQSPRPDLERLRRGLAQIDAQATRIAALTAEMMDISRIRLGRFEIVRGPTEFDTVLARVLERAEPSVAGRVRLVCGPESGRAARWDAERLEAVVENLLSNAVKFSPTNAPITIAVTGTPSDLLVSVADEGRGVDATELPRLFERFYRAAEVADSEIEGSGIGLYVTRGIVEAHGGRVWADSPGLGAGTTILFTLPWEEPSPEQPGD